MYAFVYMYLCMHVCLCIAQVCVLMYNVCICIYMYMYAFVCSYVAGWAFQLWGRVNTRPHFGSPRIESASHLLLSYLLIIILT